MISTKYGELKRREVKKDGNCFFHSVFTLFDAKEYDVQKEREKLRITDLKQIENISSCLLQEIVNENLKDEKDKNELELTILKEIKNIDSIFYNCSKYNVKNYKVEVLRESLSFINNYPGYVSVKKRLVEQFMLLIKKVLKKSIEEFIIKINFKLCEDFIEDYVIGYISDKLNLDIYIINETDNKLMKLYNLKHRNSIILYYVDDNHFDPLGDGVYKPDNPMILDMYRDIKNVNGYLSDSD